MAVSMVSMRSQTARSSRATSRAMVDLPLPGRPAKTTSRGMRRLGRRLLARGADDAGLGDLARDLVGRPALAQGLVEDLFQGQRQAVELLVHPGRVERLAALQGADLAGDVDDAAAV